MRAEFSSVPCSVAVPRQPSEFSLSSWERCSPALTRPEVGPYTAAAVIFISELQTKVKQCYLDAVNQEKALVGAFSVIMNLGVDLCLKL